MLNDADKLNRILNWSWPKHNGHNKMKNCILLLHMMLNNGPTKKPMPSRYNLPSFCNLPSKIQATIWQRERENERGKERQKKLYSFKYIKNRKERKTRKKSSYNFRMNLSCGWPLIAYVSYAWGGCHHIRCDQAI